VPTCAEHELQRGLCGASVTSALITSSVRASLAGAFLAAGSSFGAVSAALAADLPGVEAGVPSAAQSATQASGFNAFETLIVLAPLLLYGIFSLYRSKLNPKAKLSDFFFAVGGVVVVANILSIIVFKKRFF